MTDKVLLNNRYVLEKPIGKGGMATVYRALDQMLERTIAIKLLREDYSSDLGFRSRFHQEAKAAANLVHPNIVTVHDFGMDSNRLYIVMEYVPGSDLNTLLQKRGRFTVDETLPLIRQACAGVGYAHRAGLIHCDIKPHNFLITPDNRLKVTDFGIARALETVLGNQKEVIVWGSPQYFSPEQAAGKPPSPASDVYSLGVVMYFMLTGRLPFTAGSAEEIAQLHRRASPPKLTLFNPSIPQELEEIILKILSKEPSQRYRTADQLGRVLIAFTQSQQDSRIASQNQAPHSPGYPIVTPSQTAFGSSKAFSAQSGSSVSQENTRTKQSNDAYNSPISTNILDIDWITMLLGLVTLFAVGGLIPFWIWVYFSFK